MAKPPDVKLAASSHKAAVGRNLAQARTALGKKQAPFARKYHITANRLNQWEAGLYYPDPYVLMKICEDYGFTMDWFYRGIQAGVSVARADDLQRAAEEMSEPQPAAARLVGDV